MEMRLKSEIINLDSLELRRLRADLVSTYKIIFGLSDVSSNFFVVSENCSTRGHQFKLLLEHCETNTRKQFFAQRVVTVWNSLPAANLLV